MYRVLILCYHFTTLREKVKGCGRKLYEFFVNCWQMGGGERKKVGKGEEKGGKALDNEGNLLYNVYV